MAVDRRVFGLVALAVMCVLAIGPGAGLDPAPPRLATALGSAQTSRFDPLLAADAAARLPGPALQPASALPRRVAWPDLRTGPSL